MLTITAQSTCEDNRSASGEIEREWFEEKAAWAAVQDDAEGPPCDGEGFHWSVEGPAEIVEGEGTPRVKIRCKEEGKISVTAEGVCSGQVDVFTAKCPKPKTEKAEITCTGGILVKGKDPKEGLDPALCYKVGDKGLDSDGTNYWCVTTEKREIDTDCCGGDISECQGSAETIPTLTYNSGTRIYRGVRCASTKTSCLAGVGTMSSKKCGTAKCPSGYTPVNGQEETGGERYWCCSCESIDTAKCGGNSIGKCDTSGALGTTDTGSQCARTITESELSSSTSYGECNCKCHACECGDVGTTCYSVS